MNEPDYRENIVLREQPETAVYTNTNGDIVVRQWSYPDDDAYIIIAPSNVETVVLAMLKEAGRELPRLAPLQVMPPEPKSTNAARQKRYRERHGSTNSVTVGVTRDTQRNGASDNRNAQLPGYGVTKFSLEADTDVAVERS